MDLVLTEDDEHPGHMLAHLHLDCPVVLQHRIDERPILTLFGVTTALPPYLREHNCEDCG